MSEDMDREILEEMKKFYTDNAFSTFASGFNFDEDLKGKPFTYKARPKPKSH